VRGAAFLPQRGGLGGRQREIEVGRTFQTVIPAVVSLDPRGTALSSNAREQLSITPAAFWFATSFLGMTISYQGMTLARLRDVSTRGWISVPRGWAF
jgi:hypothetical protein